MVCTDFKVFKSWQLGGIETIMYLTAVLCIARAECDGVSLFLELVWCVMWGQTVQRWAPVNWLDSTLQLTTAGGPSPARTSDYLPLLSLRVHQRQWRQWTLATIPGSAVLSSFVRGAETASRISILIDSTIYTTVKSLGTFLWTWLWLHPQWGLKSLKLCRTQWFNINAGKRCQLSTCCAIVYFCKSQCLEMCRVLS